ncbi:MAG TPA: PKD domain-containing protein, partial [Saprospiraceae bacterium]|nr:PKD domain-containing protein [Saprospiraceae bacterium]
MNTKHLIIYLVLFVLSISKVSANHIIGGVMSYECLGNNKYKISLKIYRDCKPGNAGFDSPANIGIYRCGNTINCASLGQIDAVQIQHPKILKINNINTPDYPCLDLPPVVCVEEGIYEFTVTLPKSNESYFLAYQRCCRNGTITNIVNSGVTLMVEITPEAQQINNSSPVFNNFPPTLICANELLEFDHSADDKDGDQLVYSLCSPLTGAGNQLGIQCISSVPDPSCPPPYSDIQFVLPAYSFDKPLGQNSIISIDPFTGLLTVKAAVVGQFVVGICVSDYKNGVLLSRVLRDFQFNVASCQPEVISDIKCDYKIGPKKYVIDTCVGKTISLINKSAPLSAIYSYEWTFPQGILKTFTTKNATVSFPTSGTFNGIMVLNGGTNCSDTSEVIIKIFPEIHADFISDYDTCKAEPVHFMDKSQADAGKVQSWYWDFGNSEQSNIKNPYHGFKKPGIFNITLRVIDINGCEDSTSKLVNYYPVPPLINIQPSAFSGCVPGTVFFNNLSKPIDSSYTIEWDFGDGSTSNQLSPTHIFDSAGVYTISVDITSPIGCKTSESFTNYITIESLPVADFIYTPEDPSNLNPEVQFKDLSSGAAYWGWSFGDSGHSIIQNPFHIYTDTGLFVITQYIVNKSGCIDSLSKIIDIKPVITYYLPNAFTP